MGRKRKRATAKEKKAKTYDDPDPPPNADIPQEVQLQILHRLPVKSLMRFLCVSKFWSQSIVDDNQFIQQHFLESQKNPILIFKYLPNKLDFIGYPGFLSDREEYHTNHLFYLRKHDFLTGRSNEVRPLPIWKNSYKRRLIGYCNGLACYLVSDECFCRSEYYSNNGVKTKYFFIEIFNFTKLEKLRIVSRIQSEEDVKVADCRFGYDPLTKEYKIMCVLECYFHYVVYHKFLMFTPGSTNTQPWREIENPMPKDRLLYMQFKDYTHCNIDGAFYWEMHDKQEKGCVFLWLDIHEEKIQVIKLPAFNNRFCVVYHYHHLEYKGCFCLAKINKFGSHSGEIELHMLKDRIQQVWVKETIAFDLPLTVRNPPSTPCNYSLGATTFSFNNKKGITTMRIIEFAGRICIYWRRKLLRGKGSHIIQFYDLHSRKLKEVKGPNPADGKCGYEYNVMKYVENLFSLKAWATREGDGGGVLGRDECRNMFQDIPPSDAATVSFYSSLSFSGENNELLVV